MLIGQTGQLDFARFFLWCAPPSLLALCISYLVIILLYRRRMIGRGGELPSEPDQPPPFNRWQTGKGLAAVLALIVLFVTPAPRELSAIGIAGILLCSRRMKTRDITGLVDWHLITLFCALFIIIHGFSASGYLEKVMGWLAGMNVDVHGLPVLTALSAVLSNLFSNVPAVMLLVSFLDVHVPAQWYTLAVSSTFAGNLFLLGSIANLIVVEQAANCNIRITFSEHARVGIPVTLLSLLILLLWIAVVQ